MDLHRRTGLKVVWDILHHHCNDPDGIPDREALELALATWPAGVVPKIHYSTPKTAMEERKRRVGRRVERSWVLPQLRAHADMIDPIGFEHFLRETAAGLELRRDARGEGEGPRAAAPARAARRARCPSAPGRHRLSTRASDFGGVDRLLPARRRRPAPVRADPRPVGRRRAARRPAVGAARHARSSATAGSSGGSRSRSCARSRSRRSRSPPRSCGPAATSSSSQASLRAPAGGARSRGRPPGGCAATRTRWRSPDDPPPPGPEHGAERPFFPTGQAVGYHTAMDYRFLAGSFLEAGPGDRSGCACASRSSRASRSRPLARVLVAADSGNGVSAALDFRRHPLHQHRADRAPHARAGRRVGLPGRGDAAGHARRRASRRRCSPTSTARLGRSAQTLLVRAR